MMSEFLSTIYGLIVYNIFPLIVVLGILVFVHELGHFVAAKLSGVRVERFSIGFPPRLFGIQVGDTDYCVSAVPLGGYVKMSGMIDESMDGKVTGATHEFMSKSTLQKVFIITAGVIMNFLLGIGLLAGVVWTQGEKYTPVTTIGYVGDSTSADSLGFRVNDRILSINGTPVSTWEDLGKLQREHLGDDLTIRLDRAGDELDIVLPWSVGKKGAIAIAALNPAVIGKVRSGQPAEKAGLKVGDRIISIQDSAISSWLDMSAIISAHSGTPVTIVFMRGENKMTTEIVPEPYAVGNDENGNTIYRGVIGIESGSYRTLTLWQSIETGFWQAISLGMMNARGFGMVLSGQESARETLGGPLFIMEMIGEIFKAGDYTLLIRVVAMLSVVLAFVNILPIPALDGGHLMIILIEGVRKKPLAVNTKLVVQQVGMVLLLFLMVFVFYNDIARWFSR